MKVRPYKIARSCKYDGYQRALASMNDNCFDKKTESKAIVTSNAGESVNEQY